MIKSNSMYIFECFKCNKIEADECNDLPSGWSEANDKELCDMCTIDVELDIYVFLA